MTDKAELFNLALGALLLSSEIIDPEADKTLAARTLRKYYETAKNQALQDMDLNGTATLVMLELLDENPNDHWGYAFKYPNNCAHLRRIANRDIIDTPDNQIQKQTGVIGTHKVIFTNEAEPVAEIIPKDISLNTLSEAAKMAIATKLAWLSTPLIAGKGAKTLKQELQKDYIFFVTEAQKKDSMENHIFDDPQVSSQFVSARMS